MKVFGFTGWKSTGMSGLMERLVRDVATRNLTVPTLRHAHHAATTRRATDAPSFTVNTPAALATARVLLADQPA